MAGGGGGANQAPIIIKKIKKGGDGHHGGAWKVAYADFVTAMMAFFLLLWLLNVTTSEQKMSIADYFSPASPSKQESGSGGILGGQTITAPGAQINAASPPQIAVPAPGLPSAADAKEQVDDATEKASGGPDGQTDGLGLSEAERQQILDALEQRSVDARSADTNRDGDVSKEELREALAKIEQQQFERAAAELRQAIQQVPELRDLQESLIIEQTPEGLRLQLVDQEGYSMFPSGSSQMLPQTAQLLANVAQVVSKLPNKVEVYGHTDSIPFASGSGRSNWDLSSERASAARRALEAAGVGGARFAAVTGKADTDHLFPEEPDSPRNRRISIVLLREQPLLGEAPPPPSTGSVPQGTGPQGTAPQRTVPLSPSPAPPAPLPTPR